MSFPDHFLSHLEGSPGFSGADLSLAHQAVPPTSIRLNPHKPAPIPFERSPIPWSRTGFYLDQRPSFTFDPLFHAGAYYVQEASSQLLEPFVLAAADVAKPLRVLDLCAAPGGKSTHLLTLLSAESLLVSNEVIRGRTGILSDNLDKWGYGNTIVTQEDPSVLGQLKGFFDLIVVDAPCSGSGLFRKDPAAMDHWSLSAVDHCAARQKRILKDIWPALREGGAILYSTCSFSVTENEQVVEGILQEYPSELVQVDLPPEWGVTVTDVGYRCWPHRLKGEGFFISLLRKTSSETTATGRGRTKWEKLSREQEMQSADWWSQEGVEKFFWREACWAIPSTCLPALQQLTTVCEPIRTGTRLGSWSRKDWIPDHALALSRWRATGVPVLELDLDGSIRYLQRGSVDALSLARGWHVINYKGLSLGWVKSIGNRVNNYYPAHLRILKQTRPGA